MNTQIQDDLKQAMRDKDTLKLDVLRALKNEITNASLRKGSVNEVLSNTEIIALVRKEVAKRQDSNEAFIKANRQDLADKEVMEIHILNNYLPLEMLDDELAKIVDHAINQLQATSKKDMGKVIKLVVEQANGRADNRRISALVGQKLA